MKNIITILSFILIVKISLGNPNKIIIALHFNNNNFVEFTEYIHSKTNVKIFYSDPSLSELRVSINTDSISVYDALVFVLKETDFKVQVWHNNLIITKSKMLISELPPYVDTKNNDTVKSITEEITEIEKRYLVGRKPDVIEQITIGKNQNGNKVVKTKIKGKITDKETGEPIIGATINIEELGLGGVTNENGILNIAVNSGKYNVRFDCLGYSTKKFLFEILSDGEFETQLEKAVISIQEVTVKADRKTNITTKSPGMEKITPKNIKEIPMMMGERDIIKVSETLPGIVSVGEGSAGLNVRGGGSDQNLFYINKVPIYNTFHVFGFFPAFNSDIIKDFSIYKGYIPAQYGGRLSSIFNVITKQGNRKNFTARGGINPITANLTVEGPIKKDTSTILLSARSSYSDWILAKINEPTIRNSNSNFYDISALYNRDINKNNQLGLFYYQSNDYFKFSTISTNSYSNLGASINWRHTFTPSFRGEFSAIGSNYAFSTTNNEDPGKAYSHEYKIGHYETRGDLYYLVNEKHSVEGGISLIYYNLNRGTVNPYGNESLRLKTPLGSEKAVESAIYVSDSYDITSNLNFVMGLRYSLFSPIGAKDVYKYSPNSPFDKRYITDTLHFENNEIIKTYSLPEARISITYKTDSNGSLKLSFNQSQQSIFMLSNTLSVAPNTQWKLSDYHLKPSRSNQVSFGVFRNFPSKSIEASIEIYGKQTSHFSEFKDGADFINNPITETQIIQGNQSGYGLEVLLKRTNRKLEGWLSYTYSKSTIKVDGKQPWQKINDGNPYPSNYDIPHVLNLVANLHLSRRITFSTIATYQTGKPVTYPLSIFYINGVPYIDYSKRNEFRIPEYFRVDCSLALEGNLKKKKAMHSSFMISVYNALGRKNPYTVYFKSENGVIKGYKYSVIGVPLVTFTWLIKLGNYATD